MIGSAMIVVLALLGAGPPAPSEPEPEPNPEPNDSSAEPSVPGAEDDSAAPEVPLPAEPSEPGEAQTEAEVDDDAATEQRALEHLRRAQQLVSDGDRRSAEAEVSAAIALSPSDAALYLERAQVRVGLADEAATQGGPQARRARAALLRAAAEDVAAYIRHASLDADGRAWFEARKTTLLREADALDPPADEAEPAAPEPPPPEPAPPAVARTDDPGAAAVDAKRRSSTALLATGSVLAAGGSGLAASSLQIERRCDSDMLCSVKWRPRAPLLGPAVALGLLGTSAVVVGALRAKRLDDRGRRRAVGTTLGFGAGAVVAGSVFAAVAGSQWRAPLSPSDDGAIMGTQRLANASAASFAVALPLLSAGLSVWLRHRLRSPTEGTTAAR